jgi:hypothetical protein
VRNRVDARAVLLAWAVMLVLCAGLWALLLWALLA